MSTYNLSLLKIAKALLDDGPKIIELLDKQSKDLVKYNVYSPVRRISMTIQQSKQELLDHIKSAEKVKQNKGRIK